MKRHAGTFLQLALIQFTVACTVVDRDALTYPDAAWVPVVVADVETTPVASADDAADDPAIWINPLDPAASLVLGTDKQSGIAVYSLDGNLLQFLPLGEPNNIDLRQGVVVGDWQGDLAVASNRADNSISLLSVSAAGVKPIGGFAAGLDEPYGICMGINDARVLVFVTYKTGEVQVHRLQNIGDSVRQQQIQTLRFASQLEGCVFDDARGVLYVGEENAGVWRVELTGSAFDAPVLVDAVGGPNGLAADVEGLALYVAGEAGYLVVSSQGNDSFAVYTRDVPNSFVGRFRIGSAPTGGIDGAQETDGLEVTSHGLGPDYPAGILVAQDGYNAPAGTPQNFKLVDWRKVAAMLGGSMSEQGVGGVQ